MLSAREEPDRFAWRPWEQAVRCVRLPAHEVLIIGDGGTRCDTVAWMHFLDEVGGGRLLALQTDGV